MNQTYPEQTQPKYMLLMKEPPELIKTYIRDSYKIILWIFIIAVTIIFVLHALLAITFAYPLDYGEAPLIDQARRLSAGENIYAPDLSDPPYTVTNYPPLYVLLLSPFAESAPFQIGRLFSVTAAVGTAVLLAHIIYIFSQNRQAALATGTFFLAIPYVVHWSGLARVDFTALLLAVAALYVLVRWPNSRWRIIVAALLLIAAIYTRQSYGLAAPLAAFIWLWRQDRRQAITLAALVAGIGLALFIVLNLLTDGGFYFHLVTANVNAFRWDALGESLRQLFSDLPIALLLALAGLVVWQQPLPGRPLLAAFFVGAFLSMLTIGKIGSNVNYFLELAAALSLLMGGIIVWSDQHIWRYTLVLLLVIIQIGLALSATMHTAVDRRLASRRLDLESIRRLDQLVATLPDPVLADEYMGLLTLQDRPLYLQPFEMTQLARDGVWNQDRLVTDIEQAAFDGILIYYLGGSFLHRERWTDEMLAAINQTYRPAYTMASTVVYIPWEESEITAVPAPNQNTFNPDIAVGTPVLLSQSPHLYQPVMVSNPLNPQHLALIVGAGSTAEFSTFARGANLLLYTSTDGGTSWDEQAPITSPRVANINGTAAFAPDGTLLVIGDRDGELTLNASSAEANYEMTLANQLSVTRAQLNARPWLQIDPETAELILTFDAQQDDVYDTPAFIRSSDGGQFWSSLTRPDQHVSLADLTNNRAVWPSDIRVLFGVGDDLALVWTWGAEPGVWPRSVWLATSTDGGQTLSPPQRIAKTWGAINATSGNGRYAIIIPGGTESDLQLTVAVSADNGRSWSNALTSGDIALTFDPDKAPGLSMAPDGTIDVVFYAAQAADCAPTATTWDETLALPRVDTCPYDVYYAYSQDDGQTFSQPVPLNDSAIAGEGFVIVNGRSQTGPPAITSTDEAAYPAWVDSGELYTLRLER